MGALEKSASLTCDLVKITSLNVLSTACAHLIRDKAVDAGILIDREMERGERQCFLFIPDIFVPAASHTRLAVRSASPLLRSSVPVSYAFASPWASVFSA